VAAGGDGPRYLFVVERPQLFQRAAAAYHQDRIHLVVGVDRL